jgi:hypothetical protein
VAWLDWYARSVGRRQLLPRRLPRWTWTAALATAIGFAVVRNLPGVGFLRG